MSTEMAVGLYVASCFVAFLVMTYGEIRYGWDFDGLAFVLAAGWPIMLAGLAVFVPIIRLTKAVERLGERNAERAALRAAERRRVTEEVERILREGR